jgi:murein DD-endopeptidase MepM/ murein hydrolase activator NlpD
VLLNRNDHLILRPSERPNRANRDHPEEIVRTLLLILFTLLPFTAQAQSFCGQMGNPAAELKYISRGFAHGDTGLDMMATEGSPILAAAGGTVVYAGRYYA